MSDTDAEHEVRLSVRLKGPLASFADQLVNSNIYESHSELVRDLMRRAMYNAEQYDLKEGIIQGYADIAAGRFSDRSHDDLFNQALEELRNDGVHIAE